MKAELIAGQSPLLHRDAKSAIAAWLQEIAYQLAVHNEREEKHDTGDVAQRTDGGHFQNQFAAGVPGCLAVKVHQP